jgi:allantoinase
MFTTSGEVRRAQRASETPRLLKELGLTYVLDWTADDQPFPLNVPGMISVPYTLELNDINLFVFNSFTGAQFEQLYADSAESGRVMSLALHPFVIGQAFRAGYLAKALEHITSRPGVWLTTSDEIAEVYTAQVEATLKVAA